MKYALLFPGQGSQKVGMGKDLFENSDLAKKYFNKANEILDRDITNIIFNGPAEELNQTKNTQPAITLVSIIITELLKENLSANNSALSPSACCGHSLGEYSALYFGGVINFETTLDLVSKRGNLMQSAPAGGMAAILNLSAEKINELLNDDEYKNNLVIANHNSPSQFVISGKKDLFASIPEKVKALGGKGIILPVSGAFHSPLMEEPSKDFNSIIENIKSFSDSSIPIYQNVDALSSTEKNVIIEKLKKQMTSSVYWTQTINNLVTDGVSTVIEVGPGKVLTGLVKKINPDINCYNIFDFTSLKDFINEHRVSLQPTS